MPLLKKYEKIGIKQATAKGYIECCVPGCADFAYPTSKLRRGRVQHDGHVSPTIMSGGCTVCKIIKMQECINDND